MRSCFGILMIFLAGCNIYSGDMHLFQGTWNIVDSFGEEEKNKTLGLELLFDGDLIFRKEGEQTHDDGPIWRFEINDKISPRQIDLEVLSGPHKGEKHRGIYEFQRNGLWMAIQQNVGFDRPTGFEPGEKDSGLFVVHLIRPL